MLLAASALVLFTQNSNHIKIGVSFVDSVIYHDFRDTNIVHPVFDLESQSMQFKGNFQKSDS